MQLTAQLSVCTKIQHIISLTLTYYSYVGAILIKTGRTKKRNWSDASNKTQWGLRQLLINKFSLGFQREGVGRIPFTPLRSADEPVIPVGSLSLAKMYIFHFVFCFFFRNMWRFPSFLPPPYPFDPAPFYFHISLPSSFIFFFSHFLFCSLFLLALSFSLAFISTSYRITVRLGEYNEAVPLQLQTFPSPVCQGSKTKPEQIFWHSDTREDVCNDSKHSDSSSTRTRK